MTTRPVSPVLQERQIIRRRFIYLLLHWQINRKVSDNPVLELMSMSV